MPERSAVTSLPGRSSSATCTNPATWQRFDGPPHSSTRPLIFAQPDAQYGVPIGLSRESAVVLVCVLPQPTTAAAHNAERKGQISAVLDRRIQEHYAAPVTDQGRPQLTRAVALLSGSPAGAVIGSRLLLAPGMREAAPLPDCSFPGIATDRRSRSGRHVAAGDTWPQPRSWWAVAGLSTGRRVEAVGLALSACALDCLRRCSDPEVARGLRLRERR